MRTQRGFTLIELLVVIAIIGILATLVITQLSGATARARNSNAKSDVSQMGKAVETWKTTTNTENAVDSGAVAAATQTRVNGDGTGTCNGSVNATCAGLGWTTLFNTATTGFPVRVNKSPSTSHTYTYATSTSAVAPAMGTYTSTNYCVATTVTSTTNAQDGAFAVVDGVTTNKPSGTTTFTYANSATPCT
jgi:type IV pilus assembly protein PilA